MNAESFFQNLQVALSNPLPGPEAQYKMAPLGRNAAFLSPDKPPKKAAVLVPIYFSHDHIPHLLLTLRKIYPGVHSGQVSFPGGKYEPEETDPVQVALRETYEEVGISAPQILVAGMLTPLYIPPSNIMVQPVVGVIPKEPELKPDPYEVERLIHKSLIDWLKEQQIAEAAHKVAPGLAIAAPFYNIDHQRVWGATAMMLSEFSEILMRMNLIQPYQEE